ncbi:MAG: ribonuclease H-like domain-containing protein [Clostridia bacterium]
MADLLSKLRMLDASPPKDVPAAPRKAGEAKAGCYHAQAIFPLSTFTDRRYATPEVLQSIFGCSFPRQVLPEDILFLDTETTGLSGGAGTVAFEVGLGYFTPSGFVVEQYLMHDYSQEPELLHALCTLMKRFTVLCTFNGRAFDVPLLKSRLIMNRFKQACFPDAHADVLFPARRLWKLRLKQCTLAHLEEQLLHVVRTGDLPGALVPQAYFTYLKSGNFEPLLDVLSHNKQDIVSLAQLFYYLCYQVSCPEKMTEGEDLLSLARMLEKSKEDQKATKCYRLCSSGAQRAEAFEAMALAQKRQGKTEAAIKLYRAMAMRGDNAVSAYEALAKLCEHQLKNPEQALHYTRQALLLLSEPTLFASEAVQERQIALQYRYARLRRKLCTAPSASNLL